MDEPAPTERPDGTERSLALTADGDGNGTGTPNRLVLTVALVVLGVAAVGAIGFLAFGRTGDQPELTDEAASPGGADRLWGNRYQVVSTVERAGVAPWTPRAEPALTMTFGTDRSVAFTGCNGGRGSATVEGDRLRVADTVSTMMACGGAEGEALMAHDTRLAELLHAGVDVEGSNDDPVLRGPDGAEVRLRLVGPVPTPAPPVDDPDAPVSDDGSTSSATAPSPSDGTEPGSVEPGSSGATEPGGGGTDPYEGDGGEPATVEPVAPQVEPAAPPADETTTP